MTARGIEFARRIGDRVWEGQMLAGEISSLVLLGRWNEALERGAEIESVAGAEHLQSHLVHLVEIECWQGRPADARARLERYAAAGEAVEMQTWSAHTLHEALVLRAEGRPREALAILERELPRITADLGVTFIVAKLALVEALEAALELGQTEKLEELLGSIEALRPGERPPLLTAHAARFRARLASESAQTETGFRRATDMFRELNLVFWLAATQLEHAEWLLRESRMDEAERLLAEAREIFERLEAKPWLDRLDALQAGTPTKIPA